MLKNSIARKILLHTTLITLELKQFKSWRCRDKLPNNIGGDKLELKCSIEISTF